LWPLVSGSAQQKPRSEWTFPSACVESQPDPFPLVQKFREEGLRAVGVRDPDIGDDVAAHVFSLPGDLAPEQLLLADQNIEAAEGLLNGLGAAFDRAKVAGIGHQGSARAKRVFPALAAEMDIPLERLQDRLTISWLLGNAPAAQELVAAINRALP